MQLSKNRQKKKPKLLFQQGGGLKQCLNPEPEDPVPNDEGSWILICDARYAGTQNVSSAFKVQMHIEN